MKNYNLLTFRGMEYYAKIIHKTRISYLPTNFPVQFYGMPDGKVFLIYARSSKVNPTSEFVFAEHKEFFYDNANNQLMYLKQGKSENAINNDMIDKPSPLYSIFKVSRTIKSYCEAFNELNLMALEIINNNAIRRARELNIIHVNNVHQKVG